MHIFKETMCTAAGFVVGFASYFLGGFSPIVSVFMTILIIDTLTGMLKAWNNGEYESKKFRSGFVKKSGYLIGVLLTVQIDILLNTHGVLRDAVLTFFIANESFSIIENLGEMGIKFPEKVTAAIKSLNNDNKED